MVGSVGRSSSPRSCLGHAESGKRCEWAEFAARAAGSGCKFWVPAAEFVYTVGGLTEEEEGKEEEEAS